MVKNLRVSMRSAEELINFLPSGDRLIDAASEAAQLAFCRPEDIVPSDEPLNAKDAFFEICNATFYLGCRMGMMARALHKSGQDRVRAVQMHREIDALAEKLTVLGGVHLAPLKSSVELDLDMRMLTIDHADKVLTPWIARVEADAGLGLSV